MKKNINMFFFIFLALSIILNGCSFIFSTSDINSTSDSESSLNETIDTFDFVTDDKMVLIDSSDSQYYNLVLFAGESYQIKTTIDDELGENYYFKYTVDEDYLSDDFTLSETGLITTFSDITSNGVFVIDVDLYSKESSEKIENKYFVFSLRVGEYANITLTNENLEYDANTSTYSLTLDSGAMFIISYSISYNTAYSLSFNLTDTNYEEFMSVDDKGLVKTYKTSENKVGEISIKLTGSNGVLDEKILKVNLIKSEEIINEFKVYNQTNASLIHHNDTLTIYKNDEISFDVKYNNELKTNVIKVGDENVLSVDESTNTIKALNVGSSEVTFSYENEVISITVNVIKDNLISLFALNESNDFVIVNGSLHLLNSLNLKYSSGKVKEITDISLVNVTIIDKNETHKTVTFSYVEDNEEVNVTYDVKYYVTNEYKGLNTSYYQKDLYNNHLYGQASVLPNKGTVKMLVVPVWFADSTKFFNETQKSQIIEDIRYTINGNRPDEELSSLKQYYETQSYGAITMDLTISDFYNSSASYKDFTDNNNSSKVNNDNYLANDVITWYFANNTNEKFSDYDLNNDGYLDGLIILYGSNYYGVESDGNSSYAFATTNYNNDKYMYNTYCFCPIGSLYGLAKKEPTTQLSASDLSSLFARNFQSSARVIIHEVGHMFGNDDLYEKNTSTGKYNPAGGFVMQDNNTGGHDPYHINTIGWSKPEVYASSDYKLGDKITIHLSDFQSSGQNIILTNTWNDSNSLFDEYLILELFAPTKLNKYDAEKTYMNSTISGIRLWHVNSLLIDYSNNGSYSSQIIDNQIYELASSNYDKENKYDTLHLIRNNPNEQYNTNTTVGYNDVLFEAGDSFDMDTYKSQFLNGNKLDNNDKLGWTFYVETIYKNIDGTYGAIITLQRTDNTQTEFNQKVALNRSDIEAPSSIHDYSNILFGENSNFTFTYKYVTPPSFYEQGYPISSNGMCLFASSDGNGGYIDLTINEMEGKTVLINSISITYSYLTNASLSVIVNGSKVEGVEFEPEDKTSYGYTFIVNSNSVRIQNQYNETINHWSILALYELTIDYTII